MITIFMTTLQETYFTFEVEVDIKITGICKLYVTRILM